MSSWSKSSLHGARQLQMFASNATTSPNRNDDAVLRCPYGSAPLFWGQRDASRTAGCISVLMSTSLTTVTTQWRTGTDIVNLMTGPQLRWDLNFSTRMTQSPGGANAALRVFSFDLILGNISGRARDLRPTRLQRCPSLTPMIQEGAPRGQSKRRKNNGVTLRTSSMPGVSRLPSTRVVD